MRWTLPFCFALGVVFACGGSDEGDEVAPEDTLASAGATPGGAGGAVSTEETTVGAEATTAATVEATGAPAPPDGYAFDSRPAGEGQLAVIEYASSKTVDEVGAFYESQIDAERKVELEMAGDNMIAYGLSAASTIGPATTPMDVQRLLEERSEPILVVSPWKMQRDDPLIGDLREAGLATEADRLLNTKSKVTVVYAVN
jgi:hypothetical protein